jgi:hypothetical protein
VTPEELAEVVIATVQREPHEPSGLGMHRIVASLFRQFADKAVALGRERCAKLVEGYAQADEDGEFVRPELGYWAGGGGDGECEYTPDEVALAKAIRDGASPPRE